MYLTIVAAAKFLVDHVEEPVTLRDVADHVGYSPFHVARSFERFVGMPPGQFLAGHRFQRAKRLLLDGDEKVIDVCNAVGFSSVGTFTSRFVDVVGLNPTAFRRLPDLLAARPPRPVRNPGAAADGAVVTGTVMLTPKALAAVGGMPHIYVGLFNRRSARGVPVAGTLLEPEGDFLLLDVPPGAYWLLGSALAGKDDAPEQLVPRTMVVGASERALRIPPRPAVLRSHLVLDVVPDWSAPVLVALPALASPVPR